MNTIEERIRAAARAAADTVEPDSVPPLGLPAAPRRRWLRGGRSTGATRTPWAVRLAPVAALAVIAIVITMVTVSRTESGPSGRGATAAAAPNVPAGPRSARTSGPARCRRTT
jgi:hypothetical protein